MVGSLLPDRLASVAVTEWKRLSTLVWHASKMEKMHTNNPHSCASCFTSTIYCTVSLLTSQLYSLVAAIGNLLRIMTATSWSFSPMMNHNHLKPSDLTRGSGSLCTLARLARCWSVSKICGSESKLSAFTSPFTSLNCMCQTEGAFLYKDSLRRATFLFLTYSVLKLEY